MKRLISIALAILSCSPAWAENMSLWEHTFDSGCSISVKSEEDAKALISIVGKRELDLQINGLIGNEVVILSESLSGATLSLVPEVCGPNMQSEAVLVAALRVNGCSLERDELLEFLSRFSISGAEAEAIVSNMAANGTIVEELERISLSALQCTGATIDDPTPYGFMYRVLRSNSCSAPTRKVVDDLVLAGLVPNLASSLVFSFYFPTGITRTGGGDQDTLVLERDLCLSIDPIELPSPKDFFINAVASEGCELSFDRFGELMASSPGAGRRDGFLTDLVGSGFASMRSDGFSLTDDICAGGIPRDLSSRVVFLKSLATSNCKIDGKGLEALALRLGEMPEAFRSVAEVLVKSNLASVQGNLLVLTQSACDAVRSGVFN